jgi:hypothetical protein
MNLHEKSDLQEAHVVHGAGLRLRLGAARDQALPLQDAQCSQVSRVDITMGMVQKEAQMVLGAGL